MHHYRNNELSSVHCAKYKSAENCRFIHIYKNFIFCAVISHVKVTKFKLAVSLTPINFFVNIFQFPN